MANLNFTLTQDAVTAFSFGKQITVTKILYKDNNGSPKITVPDVVTSIQPSSDPGVTTCIMSLAAGYSSTSAPTSKLDIYQVTIRCTIQDKSGEYDFANYSQETPIYTFAAGTDYTISVLINLVINANDSSFIIPTPTYSVAPATTSREGVVQLATPEQVADYAKTSADSMPLVVQPGDGFSVRGVNTNLFTYADHDTAYIHTDGDASIGLTNESVTISAYDDELQVKTREVDIGSPGTNYAFNVYGNQTIVGGLSVGGESNIVDDYYCTHLFHLVKDEGWRVVAERVRTSGINNCFFYTRNKNIVSDLGRSANLIKDIGLYGLTTGTFTYNNDSYFYAYNPNKEIEVNPSATSKPSSAHKYYFCFLCKGYNSQEAFNAEKWYFGVIEITSSDNWNFSTSDRDAFFMTAADSRFIVRILPDGSIITPNIFSVGQKFEVKNNVHTPDESGNFKYSPDLYLLYYDEETDDFLRSFEYSLSTDYNYSDSNDNWHEIYHNFDSYPTMEPYASKMGGFYTKHYSEIPQDSDRRFSSKKICDFFTIYDAGGHQASCRWVILGNEKFSPYGRGHIGYEIVSSSDSEFSFDSYAKDEVFRRGQLGINLYLYYNAFYLDNERVFVANKDFIGEMTWYDLYIK